MHTLRYDLATLPMQTVVCSSPSTAFCMRTSDHPCSAHIVYYPHHLT